MIRGIHHTAISTGDLDRIVGFYRDVIGFEVVSETAWRDSPAIDGVIGVPGSAAKQVMMRAGNAYLEFFEYSAPQPRYTERLAPYDRGYTHICLDVLDIGSEFDRLSAAGVVFVQPRYGDFGEIKAVYGRDPDGNIIEIMETSSDHPTALCRLSVPGH